MSQCIICNNKTSLFGNIRTKSGKVCRKCCKKIPTVMLTKKNEYTKYAFTYAIDYVQNNYDTFVATASYGKLHIDEKHGLFAISRGLLKGKPRNKNNIFSIEDLEDVGLFLGTPRVNCGSVLVDVKFICKLSNLNISIFSTIKRSVVCRNKRVNSSQIQWFEPDDMVMFEKIFNDMLQRKCEEWLQYCFGKSAKQWKIEKAKALFLLDDDFSIEDLKRAKNRLLSVGNANEGYSEKEKELINESYNLLRSTYRKSAEKAHFVRGGM